MQTAELARKEIALLPQDEHHARGIRRGDFRMPIPCVGSPPLERVAVAPPERIEDPLGDDAWRGGRRKNRSHHGLRERSTMHEMHRRAFAVTVRER
jgi:hypothetical protein